MFVIIENVIPEFIITEFVITDFDEAKFVINEFVITKALYKNKTVFFQNLSLQRDNKTEEQNYVFDGHSKTMCFAGGQKSVMTSLMDVENDEEMSDVDCRKRAGDKDVSTDLAVQVEL